MTDTKITDRPIMVEAQALTRVYGDGEEVRALDGVDLIIYQGEFLSIMGPSGSGKSTLLHMLGALDRPSAGYVRIAGEDLTKIRRLDRFRSRTVGFVFQFHNLIPSLTAVENVETPLAESSMRGKKRRQWALELLDWVGLSPRARHLPSQLSGGERQRVAIARALANKPSIILADEPTGNLDTASGKEIMRVFGRLNAEQGTTLIVVTHDPAVARATRRRITLRDGKICEDDPVAAAATEDLREFARSALGRQLAAGDYAALHDLGLAADGVIPLDVLKAALGRLQ
jgi:ABC-type lipoprotein export system ATPase subunit